MRGNALRLLRINSRGQMTLPKMRLAVAVAACTFTGCASTETDATTETATDAAVTMLNTKCPISGEELDGDSPTVMHGDYAIGVCCGNCEAKVEGWSDDKKDQFIADALASK